MSLTGSSPLFAQHLLGGNGRPHIGVWAIERRMNRRKRSLLHVEYDQETGLYIARLGGVVQSNPDNIISIMPRWRHEEVMCSWKRKFLYFFLLIYKIQIWGSSGGLRSAPDIQIGLRNLVWFKRKKIKYSQLKKKKINQLNRLQSRSQLWVRL